MGITIKTKTNKKATTKLLNAITSYLFEQEFDELRGVSSSDIQKIKDAKIALYNIMSK